MGGNFHVIVDPLQHKLKVNWSAFVFERCQPQQREKSVHGSVTFSTVTSLFLILPIYRGLRDPMFSTFCKQGLFSGVWVKNINRGIPKITSPFKNPGFHAQQIWRVNSRIYPISAPISLQNEHFCSLRSEIAGLCRPKFKASFSQSATWQRWMDANG